MNTWRTLETEADLVAYLFHRGDCRLAEPTPSPDIAPLPPETPEQRLLDKIRRLATTHGWLVYHTHDSRKSEPGFCDLVIAKPGRLVFAELKSRTGKVTVEQQQWLDMLRHTVPGVEVYVWRPEDWGNIVQILIRK